MIENNNPEGAKRYARPAQRIRSHQWRKSGDRFEKANYSYGIDGEKSRDVQNENTHPVLIPIDGCCTSQAAQLLNERWANAMHLYNDPSIDLSEKQIHKKVPNMSLDKKYWRNNRSSCLQHYILNIERKTSDVFWSWWVIMGSLETSSSDELSVRITASNSKCSDWCCANCRRS